jgi:hypothetical protein
VTGYRLSKVLSDIGPPQNRAAFEDARLLRERYRLTQPEIDAFLGADLAAMYELGANPYLIRFAFRDKYDF